MMRIMKGACAMLAMATLAVPAAAEDPSMAAYQQSKKLASAPTLVARYGADDLRSGQLRMPKGKGPFPVAVVIHGGCWRNDFDTNRGMGAFADALTKRGIATWNIEYRRLGDAGAGWPGTFEDVAAGVDYLKVLARSQPIDLKRVTIIGHSAGAHLAMWAASRGRLGAPWSPRVKPLSVVSIDGPATLTPFIGLDQEQCGRPVISELMGGAPSVRAKEYALAQPADHLPLGVHQLIVLATFGQFMKRYADTARAAGDRVDVLQAGETHFDVVTPGTPNGDRAVDFIASKAFTRK